MRTCKAQITGFLAALLIVLMTGCGKETVEYPRYNSAARVIHHPCSKCNRRRLEHDDQRNLQ